MPGRPAASIDRERFPEYKDEIGEDPARYLDADLVERGPSHTDTSRRRMVFDRIASIDRFEVIEAWLDVETSLDRGPRKPVIAALNERKDHLEEIGERPDRLGPRRDPEPTESIAVFANERGSSATAKLAEKRDRARADGGDPE